MFRVHEGPTPEKLELLRSYLKALGLNLSLSDEPAPGEFQAIAKATEGRPDVQQIHTMLLRSMQQAIYTPINSGHFGLAFEAYTHFTSPIRRYPDLLVHRVIKAILTQKRYELPNLPMPGEAHAKLSRRLAQRGRAAPPPGKGKAGAIQAAWEAAGLHCSANERRADEASQDVQAWLKCKFMRDHLGEEYAGVVSAVTSFGVFVTLDALYVEGLVHITELGGEYFRFDEVRQELRGERTGIRYAIGSRVRIQVSRVDLDGRKIDFRLVHDELDRAARPTRSERGSRSHRDEPAPAAPAKAKSRAKGRKTEGSKALSDQARLTPIQALKSAVKKAAANKKGKAKKGRR